MPRPGRFTPGKVPVPIVQGAGWAPGPVWTGAGYLAPTRIRSRTVQSVASRYTDCAIPAPPITFIALFNQGHTVAQLVEALRYNPEGRGFDSR
jgi:hypothetical protein